jgi:small subunit ribosomal protein S18
MTSKSNKIRMAKAAIRKTGKKKPNAIDTERVKFVDYKDINLLQRFMSDRSKIRGQRIAGTTVQQQRDIASAVKNAREMALLPYAKRVSSTRAPRAGGDREDREDRGDRGNRGERSERSDNRTPRESTVAAVATENTDVVEIVTNGEEA